MDKLPNELKLIINEYIHGLPKDNYEDVIHHLSWINFNFEYYKCTRIKHKYLSTFIFVYKRFLKGQVEDDFFKHFDEEFVKNEHLYDPFEKGCRNYPLF